MVFDSITNPDNNHEYSDITITLRLMGFLNASHFAVFDGKQGQNHGHSWQLQFEVEVPVIGEELIRFEDLEKLVTEVLKPYQRTVLNQIAPFNRIQPFTENIAIYFFNTFSDLLEIKGSRLAKLIVWENPTKGVEIAQRIPLDLLAGQGEGAVVARSQSLNNFPAQLPVINEIAAATAPDDTVISDGEQTVEIMQNLAQQPEPLSEPVAEQDSDTVVQLEEAIESAEDKHRPLVWAAKKPGWWVLPLIVSLIVIFSLVAYKPVLSVGPDQGYPWGSDAWGHLYKAQFLTEQIAEGNYFPQFWATWYNGCQPFRYWAPLPYYTLAGLNSITGDIFSAGYYYIYLCALIGALGWLLWRRRMSPLVLLLVALAFLIWPDNIRVAFSEGNFPRILSTALLPILVACYLNVLENKKPVGYFILTVILIHLAVLCHAMMGAVDCVALLLVTVFHWLYGGSSLKQAGRAVSALILGVLLSSWWLLPALKGGMVGMGSAAASGGVFYLSFLQAFNPLHFKVDREFAYLGISLLPLMVFTLATWRRRPVWSRSLFTVGMLLIIISFPTFSWLHRLMPLSDMLWPFRFRSIAGVMLLASMAAPLVWPAMAAGKRKLSQVILTVLLLFVLADAGYAARYLIYPGAMPEQVLDVSKRMAEQPGWRAATLDISTLGSPPSYLLSVEGKREQVFGWAWQGATTASNIMLLNTAMENNLYPYVLRQILLLGGTDVITNSYSLKQPLSFDRLLTSHGFEKQELASGSQLSYWHGLDKPYLVQFKPSGLVIGKTAGMYAMQFPSLQIGDSTKIDDYSLTELKRYPKLILTGADWKSRSQAEELIIAYARQGGQVYVDLNGFPSDVFSKQPKFLNVYGQSVTLSGSLVAQGEDGSTRSWLPFDQSQLPWLTIVPMPLDSAEWTFNYQNRSAVIFGYREIADVKIGFIGANPVYHSFLTGDAAARQMLGQWLGLEQDVEGITAIPVLDYQVNSKGYTFTYTLAEQQQVIIPIAKLEGMQVYLDQQPLAIDSFENLVAADLPAGTHTLQLELNQPPVYKLGWAVSGIALLLTLLAVYLAVRGRSVFGS